MALTDKRFQFWRVLVALAHTDGMLDKGEEDFLVERIKNTSLSNEQKSQLAREIHDPQDPIALFEDINNLQERAECLYMAHQLFASDSGYHPIERKMYERLVESHYKDLDKDLIIEKVKKQLDVEEKDNKPTKRIEKVVDWLVNFMN